MRSTGSRAFACIVSLTLGSVGCAEAPTDLMDSVPLLAAFEGGVCDGNIRLQTQAEIDAFACTTVTGSLTISNGPSFSVFNLDALSGLTSVGGSLAITQTGAIKNVDGLSSLTSVGGFLVLYENYGLTNLAGLSALKSIGGSTFIELNPMLTNLQGFGAVEQMGDLTIINNQGLTSLQGFSSLKSISLLDVRINYALEAFDGFPLLETASRIVISSNDVITHIDGLSSLRHVGDLLIEMSSRLMDVDELGQLESAGSIIFVANQTLSKCACGLYALLEEGRAGSIQVDLNAPGCNSLDDISADACSDCADRDIVALVDQLRDTGALSQQRVRMLLNRLASARSLASAGRFSRAVNRMDRFIDTVERFESQGRISSDAAADLFDAVERLRDAYAAQS